MKSGNKTERNKVGKGRKDRKGEEKVQLKRKTKSEL